ncbi:hypothetical protein BD769DRAFT_1395464 [Suillus cothurnatus]|nr:hypothetical protein BD769DRAFT_1395464 [Suillus cothurnatus]
MSGKNLQVPSGRIPAGVYISITVESRGCWKSAISVLSSDRSVVWGNTVTLPSHTSPALSVEIRASYKAGRMLGSGKVIRKLQMSWDELLDHGDEPFDVSFPPVRNVCPSLTLRAAAVHACDDQDNTLSDSLVDSDITRDTDPGHARLARYMRSRMVFLLNDAVQHFQSVLDQYNLGGALVTRFKKCGDIDDITRAISLRREALTLCPPGHPRRDTILNNLAYALKTRYDELYVSEDLNEAIDRYRESHLSTQLDHPECHVTLYNLSVVLCSRFMHTRKNGDIEEAIQLCQEALASLPSLHPDRSVVYAWLQRTYLSRYCIQHNPTDLSSAMEHFRLSSTHPTEGFPQCIMVAIEWAGQAEIYQHESALEAYQMCFELFDSHVMSRSSIFSRREAATAFHGAQSLPVDAASCAMRRDNLRHAVELLEQGRGQQWSLTSRLRTPLEDLWSANPQLAQRLSELSKHLSHAQGSTGSTDPAAADRAATEYRRLTGQWKAAVAEIRNLRAFSRFLLPPSYEDLQAAAHQGPVIILIASQYSCSAIIVPTSGDPHNVPLPAVSLTELNNLKDHFSRANIFTSCLSAILFHPVFKNDLNILILQLSRFRVFVD